MTSIIESTSRAACGSVYGKASDDVLVDDDVVVDKMHCSKASASLRLGLNGWVKHNITYNVTPAAQMSTLRPSYRGLSMSNSEAQYFSVPQVRRKVRFGGA